MRYSFLLNCCLVLVLVSQTVAQDANATESSNNNVNTSQFNTILDNIGQLPNASMVNDLLSRDYLKDVREMLNQSATRSSNVHPFTFFVPTDAAIQNTLNQHKNLTGGASDISGLENIEEGKNYIRALFHLHIVNGSYTLNQASNATVVPTYLDYLPYANLGNLSQVLYFSNSPQRLPTIESERNFSSLRERNFQFAEERNRSESNISIVSIYHTKNGLHLANVSGSAVNSSNGILYLIDSVIPIPPNATEQMYNANLTTFRSLLKATGLSKKINNNPKTTILAPSNEALEMFRKKLEGIANSSLNGNGRRGSKNYFLEGWSLYPSGLQTQARRTNHRQTPITKMSSEIDELQAFTLSGPTFQLYSTERDSDSDEVASESDNSTLSQFTRIGLTTEDMMTFLQSHIIDGWVLYASNITNCTKAVTMNGYLARLSKTSANGSFVVTIDSNATIDRTHDSSFIEPLGAPKGNFDGNATSIYTNVLTQNGVLHIMNKVVTAPAFIANVSENISKAAAANYNVQQYCDSTLKGSSNQQHQTFENELRSEAQSEPQCGQNELICWVQPNLNQMCQTAYKEGPKAFMDQLIKSRPEGTCYSGATHVCVNSTTLCPHEAPEQCSGICFNPANYSCSNHFFLCNHKSPLRCGDACYSSEYYYCKDNSILVSKQNTTAARNP